MSNLLSLSPAGRVHANTAPGVPLPAAVAQAQPLIVTRVIGKRRQPDKLIVQLSSGHVTVLHGAVAKAVKRALGIAEVAV